MTTLTPARPPGSDTHASPGAIFRPNGSSGKPSPFVSAAVATVHDPFAVTEAVAPALNASTATDVTPLTSGMNPIYGKSPSLSVPAGVVLSGHAKSTELTSARSSGSATTASGVAPTVGTYTAAPAAGCTTLTADSVLASGAAAAFNSVKTSVTTSACPSGVVTKRAASPAAFARTVATNSPGTASRTAPPSVANDHSASPIRTRPAGAPSARRSTLNPCSAPTGIS